MAKVIEKLKAILEKNDGFAFNHSCNLFLETYFYNFTKYKKKFKIKSCLGDMVG